MPSFPFVMPQMLNLTPLAASGSSAVVNLPPRSADMLATIHIKFTLGSLTNAAFTIKALNPDGSTFETIIGNGTTPLGTGTLTANGNFAFPVLVPGVKQLRVDYTTTGTATGSAAVIDCTVRQ